MRRNFLAVYFLAVILAAATGCAKKLDDAKMSSEIQTRFSQDSGLSSKQLTVQANDGVVTLSGNVDNASQREAAGRQAASIPGVKTVINNLVVGDMPVSADSSKPSASTQASDAAAQTASTPAPEKSQTGAKQATGKKSKSKKSAGAKNSAADNTPQQVAANEPPSAADAPVATPANNAPENSTPPPPPSPRHLIIDQGTQISVRLVDGIDSEKNQSGDTFHATLNAALTSDGVEAVPTGAELVGHLVDVKSASKFAGKSAVVLQLDSLASGGKTYSLQTDQYRKEGASRGKNTAEKVGGGALVGTIIGALAGGGKGAAIGAAAGAGVGGGVQAASKSQQIKLPSETVLNFVLQAPITVIQAPNGDADRPKLQ